MGGSYRRPYAAVTGVRSAAHDKMVASRSWRRAQNRAIRECEDWEDLVLPQRLEASHNNVYGWVRDGKQRFQFAPVLELHWPWTYCTAEEDYERQLLWYTRIKRK